jgi:hypothetical protein
MQGIYLNENVVNESGDKDAWVQAPAPIEPIQPDLNEFPQQQLVNDVIDLNAPTSMEVDYSDHDTFQSNGEVNQGEEAEENHHTILALPSQPIESVNFLHLELQPQDLNAIESPKPLSRMMGWL